VNKKFIHLLVLLMLFSSIAFSKEIKRVKVTSSLANIRSKPGIIGKIIKTAQKGNLFILLGKDGAWYKIALAIDKKGDPEFGYIHSSIVGIILENIDHSTNIQQPVQKTKYRELPPTFEKKQAFRTKQDKLFSGSYLKGGIIQKPKTEKFSDKWFISWGFDKPIGKYMTWGLEIQPYYRSIGNSYTDSISIKTISSNVFLNIKAGVNLGQFVNAIKFLTIYAGGGIGSNLSFTHVEWDGIKSDQFNTNFAWHIVFGTEINLGSLDLIFEIQNNKVILKDVKPATQSYSLLFIGIRF